MQVHVCLYFMILSGKNPILWFFISCRPIVFVFHNDLFDDYPDRLEQQHTPEENKISELLLADAVG